MKFEFKNIPIDLIICMIISLILIPFLLLKLEGAIRIIIGIPIVMFIPGYVTVFSLFPTKKRINLIERIGLSLGLSIAILPLIAIGLYYTPWGIELAPVLFSIYAYIVCIGSIAIFRWINIKAEKRFIVIINLSFPKFKDKLHLILSVVLIIFIITTAIYFVYVISIPKPRDKFTEFYWLGPTGKAGEYNRNISKNERLSIIIGLANHEYKRIDYTIEVWAINQTSIINGTSNIIDNMWYKDKIEVTLNHSSYGIEEMWRPQWEQEYSFTFNKSGQFRLTFLLFTNKTGEYDFNQDYKEISEIKFDNAYMDIHLNLNVL